jgi:hypothetical protein
MEFTTEAQKACYEKVAALMKELFGEFASVYDDYPRFGLSMGSAYALIAVQPWGDKDTAISTRSYVVTGIEMTPELMKYLLTKNDELLFGGFGVDSDGDIFYKHVIMGNTVDKEELRSSIMAVIYTADEEDDAIISRWGGLRATDRRSAPPATPPAATT